MLKIVDFAHFFGDSQPIKPKFIKVQPCRCSPPLGFVTFRKWRFWHFHRKSLLSKRRKTPFLAHSTRLLTPETKIEKNRRNGYKLIHKIARSRLDLEHIFLKNVSSLLVEPYQASEMSKFTAFRGWWQWFLRFLRLRMAKLIEMKHYLVTGMIDLSLISGKHLTIQYQTHQPPG
jgi:hypothetical protein